ILDTGTGKLLTVVIANGEHASCSSTDEDGRFEGYIGPRHHHHYYDYYGGGNGCRPGWTVQGGVCKPVIAMVHGASMEGSRRLGILTNMEVASAVFSFAPAASKYLSRSAAPRTFSSGSAKKCAGSRQMSSICSTGNSLVMKTSGGQYSTALDARDAISSLLD